MDRVSNDATVDGTRFGLRLGASRGSAVFERKMAPLRLDELRVRMGHVDAMSLAAAIRALVQEVVAGAYPGEQIDSILQPERSHLLANLRQHARSVRLSSDQGVRKLDLRFELVAGSRKEDGAYLMLLPSTDANEAVAQSQRLRGAPRAP